MVFLFLALSAMAAGIEEEGAHYALRTLFSTNDVQKLQEYVQNPEALWAERKAALFGEGGSIDHESFCRRYRQEAEAFIRQHPTPPVEERPWFWDNLDEIEEIVRSIIPENHPAFLSALALYYAHAYDYLCDSETEPVVCTREELRERVESFMELEAQDISEEFNQKVRWVTGDEFYIIDSLVMHSEGFFLGSVSAPQSRALFKAHEKEHTRGSYIFCGWGDAFRHDYLAHALRQYVRTKVLENYGISETAHFRLYCNAQNFSPGNIVMQAQKYLAWFYNVHEIPSLHGSYHPACLESVLFPYTYSLSDYGFCKIVPYFKEYVEWPKESLSQFYFKSRQEINETLLLWRNKYCSDGWNVSPTSRIPWRKRFVRQTSGTAIHQWRQWLFDEDLCL